jgi:GntR family transcriptional regulator/MocR family aminotransferase
MSLDENVFYLYSFTKALYPLSMVGCLVVPEKYIVPFERAKAITSALNPLLEHYALADFIEQGLLERHLKTVSRRLTRMRQVFIEQLIEAFGQRVRIPKQSASFWLCVEFDSPKPADELIQAAKDADILAAPANEHWIGRKQQRNHILIPFTQTPSAAAFALFASRCGLSG